MKKILVLLSLFTMLFAVNETLVTGKTVRARENLKVDNIMTIVGDLTMPSTSNLDTGTARIYYDKTGGQPKLMIQKSDNTGNITVAELATTANTVYSFASPATLGTAIITLGTITTANVGYLTANAIQIDLANYELQSVVNLSASTNATFTPTGVFSLVDNSFHEAICTINQIATANIAIGTEIILMTNNATHDMVLIETGNIKLGATHRTLDKIVDVIKLLKISANQWVETAFVDND